MVVATALGGGGRAGGFARDGNMFVPTRMDANKVIIDIR